MTLRASLGRPPSVQGELARDQFIQVLSPTELRIQTQLAHPESLQIALERELVWLELQLGLWWGAGRQTHCAGWGAEQPRARKACMGG